MKTRTFVALLSATALPALASPSAPPPAPVVTISAGAESLSIWPYTASDYSGAPSDPVNLVFLDTDPRAIRQALMALDNHRPAFAGLPTADCSWIDAMGNEQTAYGAPEGWVGGEVQLACTNPAQPLGYPFRVHLRLFRIGRHVLGGAHFEIQIPGTAEHEVLHWDLARNFVAFDVARTGTLRTAPTAVGLGTPGAFRAVRRPVFDALVGMGASGLLTSLGLVAPATPGADVPIPTNAQASVLDSAAAFDSDQSDLRTAVDVNYNVVVPKPFCSNGPNDFVRLQGPLHLAMRVHTTPSGKYDRFYTVSGMLRVTPLAPGGAASDALISEVHRAVLTDDRDQVVEQVSQVLLSHPQQLLVRSFASGQIDRAFSAVSCGQP